MYFAPTPPVESPATRRPTRSPRSPQAPSTAPTKASKDRDPASISWRDPAGSATKILTRPEWYWTVACALLVWEAALCSAIILWVPYTEIDFTTYLDQAGVFLSGERDYSLVKGATGPCVYPAGHLYAYSFFHYLTDAGRDLRSAQWVFAGIYVATLALVFGIYRNGRHIPPYALVFLTLSKRIHSLYILRLFNDCLAMFFLYAAVWLYTRNDRAGWSRDARWMLGTCLFSVALSVKMSILLYLPALLYLLFVYHSPVILAYHGTLLAGIQILLAAPFLTSIPLARIYFTQAFDFNREFLWEWTVNWRWLGSEVFEDSAWGKVLLMAHAAGLTVMALRWSQEEGGCVGLLARAVKRPAASPARYHLSTTRTTSVFFASNLLGILCARSLHYQFYVWFYHTLVWLVWETWHGLGIELMQKLVFLSLVEFGFVVFPSTVNSSLSLVLSLLVVLVLGWYGRPCGDQGAPRARVDGSGKEKEE